MRGMQLIPRPGVRCGFYPQRAVTREPYSFYWAEYIHAFFSSVRSPSSKERKEFLRAVHANREKLAGCDDEFIAVGIKRLRSRLVVESMRAELVAEAFALVDMVMHAHLKVNLYDTQLLAAWLMLDRRLVEMQTGEGKTLAVALAAATCALTGVPVHIVTSNDYLAERDSSFLLPVYRGLGLTVGAVMAQSTAQDRVDAYRCDITYCTAKELVFDYLVDHLAATSDRRSDMNQQPARRLRGLCMAIVDEADSVLIDDARMPLVLSEPVSNTDQSAFCRQALFLAAQLRQETDFYLDVEQYTFHLTPAGRQRAQWLAERIGGIWSAARRREETLCRALAAQRLYIKDVHYLVRDRKIVIIDESTGRSAHGRMWSRGLHQLIEEKEGCSLTQHGKTAAQITYQRFFSKYLRLSGISGTLSEGRADLLVAYGLPVVHVPLRFPYRRLQHRSRVFADKSTQWREVVASIHVLQVSGRPVLIGTESVGDSEALSLCLTKSGVPHAVLNARFDAEEARTVAHAGVAGAVTVSTNMAGRGTDIGLGPGVAELGGLHVIACQTNDSRRIDRQLFGRCARQGDPGSVQQFYCLEGRFENGSFRAKLADFLKKKSAGRELPGWFAALFRFEQAIRGRNRRRQQWLLNLNDRRREKQLGFINKNE